MAAVICVAMVYPFLSAMTTHVVGDDSLEVNFPFLTFEKEVLKEGHFPFWNPYVQAGTPDFAAPFYDFFYPLHWLIFLFPVGMGINVSFLIHGAFGWLGAYLFFRTFAASPAATVAAWLYMLSAPVLHFPQSGYLGTFYSVIALPWCLWLIEQSLAASRPWTSRAWSMTAGVLLAMCLGEVASYALLFEFLPVLIFTACRPASCPRRLSALTLLGISAVIVSLVRMWPWYLLALETHRSGAAADLSFSAAGSVHPLFLLNFLAPNFLPPTTATGLTIRGYNAVPWPIAFGLVPLVAMGRAIWSKPHGRFFTILYLAAVSLVFGIYSPVFLLCFYFLPGFSVTTHPNIYTWLAAFAACGIIAMVLNGEAPGAFRIRRVAVAAAIAAAIALACLVLMPVESKLLEYFLEHRAAFSPGNVVRQAVDTVKSLSISQAVSVLTAYGGNLRVGRGLWALGWIAAFIAISRRRASSLRIAALTVLLGADLLFHPLPKWQMRRPADYFPETQIHRHLAEMSAAPGAEPFRIYPAGGPYNTPFFKFNQGCIHRIESIKGETAFLLKNAGGYFNRIQGWPLSVKKRYAQVYGTMVRTDSRLLDLLNVKYVLSDTPIADRDLRQVESADGLYLYENSRVLPRAFFSRSVRSESSLEDVFSRIESDSYDPHEVLYCIAPADPQPGQSADKTSVRDTDLIGSIVVRRQGPNALKLTVDSPKGGWVCVGEPYVPGWTAVLEDGTRLTPTVVNGLFPAYWMPAGSHAAVVYYVPRGFEQGLWLSIAGLCAWAGAWILASRESMKDGVGC